MGLFLEHLQGDNELTTTQWQTLQSTKYRARLNDKLPPKGFYMSATQFLFGEAD